MQGPSAVDARHAPAAEWIFAFSASTRERTVDTVATGAPEDVAHLRRDEQLIFEMLPHLRFVGPGVSPHVSAGSHAAHYVSPHPLLLTLNHIERCHVT